MHDVPQRVKLYSRRHISERSADLLPRAGLLNGMKLCGEVSAHDLDHHLMSSAKGRRPVRSVSIFGSSAHSLTELFHTNLSTPFDPVSLSSSLQRCDPLSKTPLRSLRTRTRRRSWRMMPSTACSSSPRSRRTLSTFRSRKYCQRSREKTHTLWRVALAESRRQERQRRRQAHRDRADLVQGLRRPLRCVDGHDKRRGHHQEKL